MDCLQVETIADLLAGRLTERDAAAVEVHLDRCVECRELVAELVRERDTVESPVELPEAPLPRTTADGEAPLPPRIVEELPGRYHDLGEQGVGGQARVWAVFDSVTRREIALKELRPEGEDEPRRAERFLQEARLTGQLNHPSIVQVHEIGRRRSGRLYYTMPMVRGTTLAEAIAAAPDLAARLGLLDRFLDVCQGIAYAHSRGVIHRDIKPQNVMLGAFGETVLLDWGLAKTHGLGGEEAAGVGAGSRAVPPSPTGSGDLTTEGFAVGTPSYMSPEQAEGRLADVDEQTDVWGLGAVLYEILTGHPPHEADTAAETVLRVTREDVAPVREREPEVVPELAAIAEKALRRDPAARYASAKALAEEVAAYLSGGRVAAYAYSSLELLRHFLRRYRLALVATAAIFAVVVAALVGVSIAYHGERRARATAARALTREGAARDQERRERLLAHLHLAQAYLYEADRAVRARNYLAAELFAAASLLRNPGHEHSPYYDAAFAAGTPRAARMVARARPKLQAGRFSDIARRRFTLRFGTTAHQVAFAPDGRRLVVALDDGTLRLLDVRTGAELRVLRGHTDRIFAVAFGPQGRRIASTGRDLTVRIWDASTGRVQQVLRGHTRPAFQLAFHPEGTALASASMDRTVRLWDLTASKAHRVLGGHGGEVKSVAFSPNGAQLLSGGSDRVVRLWDVATGELKHRLTGHQGAVTAVAWSADGRRIASASRDGTARVWDAQTRQIRFIVRDPDSGFFRVRFWSARRRLVTALSDGTLRFYDDRSGRLRTTLKAHAGVVADLALGPAGRLFASTGNDGVLQVWESAQQIPPAQIYGHDELIFGLAYSPDGKTLATASLDGTARLWQVATGRPIHLLRGHSEEVTRVAFSPDGRRLATGSKDRTVMLWDVATGRRLHRLTGPADMVYGLAFSPDGRQLAAAGFDGRVHLWNVRTGAPEGRLIVPKHLLFNVLYAADGRSLIAGCSDASVVMWSVKGGPVTRRLTGHRDYVSGLALAGPGRLATGGKDHRVLLWDLAAGRVVRRLRGHEAWVNIVRATRDGQRLASGSDDRTVRVWSTATGRPVQIIDTSTIVVGLDIHPRGTSLAVGDGPVVRFYPLGPDRRVSQPAMALRQAERRAGVRLDGFLLTPTVAPPRARPRRTR